MVCRGGRGGVNLWYSRLEYGEAGLVALPLPETLLGYENTRINPGYRQTILQISASKTTGLYRHFPKFSFGL